MRGEEDNMEDNYDSKITVILESVDLLFSSLKVLPSDRIKEVLEAIEEKCEALKAVFVNAEADSATCISEAAFVKVEMHKHEVDRSMIDCSVDDRSNIDDFEEMEDDIEDEIDIVVEEDGKITQISSEELKT